jgi:hypothetical protein
MRKLRKFLLGFVLIYMMLLAGLLAVMRQPILFGKVMARVPEPLMYLVPFKQLWFLARAGHVRVGDFAPNFALPTLDKKARVELAAFRGQKPVVLIFGSYT